MSTCFYIFNYMFFFFFFLVIRKDIDTSIQERHIQLLKTRDSEDTLWVDRMNIYIFI